MWYPLAPEEAATTLLVCCDVIMATKAHNKSELFGIFKKQVNARPLRFAKVQYASYPI